MVLFLDQLVACSAASGIAGRGAGGSGDLQKGFQGGEEARLVISICLTV